MQGVFAVTQRHRGELDRQQEARRGGLVVVKRAKKFEEVPADDVVGQCGFVPPHGLIDQVVPHAAEHAYCNQGQRHPRCPPWRRVL